MSFTTRQATLEDLPEILQLFEETILHICKKDYNQAQLMVWTAGVENVSRWQDAVEQQYFLVATLGEKIVGFASLDKGNYLDFMYVHKDHQGQGIANLLFEELEREAQRLGHTAISSDVSKTARPFFEKKGFEVVTEQVNEILGVEIVNYNMKKEGR